MVLKEGQTWFNKTYYPTNGRAQRYLNVIGKRIVASKYRNHMKGASDVGSKIRNKVHYWWFKYVNNTLLKAEKPEAMTPETAQYLKKHLTERNAGLSELLNKDMSKLWGLDV